VARRWYFSSPRLTDQTGYVEGLKNQLAAGDPDAPRIRHQLALEGYQLEN
jgi:hypothetical protein